MDIVIVGAGFCGTVSAILLDRLGFPVTLVDRYAEYPNQFAAEQLVGGQIDFLHEWGLLRGIVGTLPVTNRAENFSRGKRHVPVYAPHYGLPYRAIVRGLRSQLPASVKFISSRVANISHNGHPVVHLANAEPLDADLVILATGLNNGLGRKLGLRHHIVSQNHSTTIGFDIKSPTFSATDKPVLCFYGNDPQDRIDYLTVFQFLNGLRANLFVYRDMRDPWVNQFRRQPATMLSQLLPEMAEVLGEYSIGNVQTRTSDVTVLENPALDGILIIGDGFQQACPAAGTGIDRGLVDIRRMLLHVRAWSSSNDLSAASLQRFYRDPEKLRADRKALHDAQFRKGLATGTTLPWKLHRQKVRVRRYLEFRAHQMRLRRQNTADKPLLVSPSMPSEV